MPPVHVCLFCMNVVYHIFLKIAVTKSHKFSINLEVVFAIEKISSQLQDGIDDEADAEEANDKTGHAKGVHEYNGTQNQRSQGGKQKGNPCRTVHLEGVDDKRDFGKAGEKEQNPQCER